VVVASNAPLANGLRQYAQSVGGNSTLSTTPTSSLGDLARGLRSFVQSMGGPVAGRMVEHDTQQRARFQSGDASPTPMTGETMDLADSVAGGIMGSIKAVGGAKKLAEGLRAYHGSPHRFDKFSLDKIGTGTGAQAYGHGLYFAESEGVAKSYRDGGALYTTRLNVEPDDLLDWDKPLSEQSAKVRGAVEGRVREYRKFSPQTMPEDPTGQQIYRTFYPQEALGDAEAKLATKPRGLEERKLMEAGIPGVRYLDQGSPGSGEGTRNFVIFDDSLVDITHVDGKPLTKAERKAAIAAMLAGGMGAMGSAEAANANK
jgi:hypothetical protein